MTDICEVTNGMEKNKKDKLFVVSHNTKCVGHQMELTEVMTRISRRYFFCASQKDAVDAKCLYRLKEKKNRKINGGKILEEL